MNYGAQAGAVARHAAPARMSRLLVALLAFVQLASAWTAGMVTPRAHVRHVGRPIVQMMDAEEPAPEPEPAPAPATPAAAEAGAAAAGAAAPAAGGVAR